MKKKILGLIIIIFIIALIILLCFKIFLSPKKGNNVISYGNTEITYNVPKGYTISSETSFSKTYINKNNYNILQYTIYLGKVTEALNMDKANVEKMKNDYQIEDKTFKINKKGLKLTGYKYYAVNKKGDTTSNVIVYYPKDNFTLSISLYNSEKKKVTEKDIEKIIDVY